MRDSLPAPGRVKEITSLANPIIKDIRLLEKKRHREETDSFLAEGMKLVIDALDTGWTLKTLIHARAGREDARVTALAGRAVAAGADVVVVPEKILSSITRRDNPQMVAGVFGRRFARPPMPNDAGDVWVALDRVRDPGNLGTVMRTIDACGACGVILVGDTTDPFATETVRATMGSVFSVPVVRMSEEAFAAHAERWPGQIVGTHLAGSIDYRVPDYSKGPVLLLMGNEQAGLTEQLAGLCTSLIRIPQAGRADSLNLAVATGIALYEVRRHAFPVSDGATA